VLLQEGNSRGAQKEFSDAIRLKSNYAEAHYNLALAFHQQGNEADSRAELEKAYEIAPSLRDAPRP
jgi:Tfp pilus assembly protein PilF